MWYYCPSLSSLNLFYVCAHICIIILCFDLNYFFCLIFLWNHRVYCVCVSIKWILSKWVNCSDWLTLNGTHIHKSTCITYLQILQNKVMFMHAYIYIYVRYVQWPQLFLECCVYRYRWFEHFLLRYDNKWLTMFFLNEMTFLSHLSSKGEAPVTRDEWETSSIFQ